MHAFLPLFFLSSLSWGGRFLLVEERNHLSSSPGQIFLRVDTDRLRVINSNPRRIEIEMESKLGIESTWLDRNKIESYNPIEDNEIEALRFIDR